MSTSDLEDKLASAVRVQRLVLAALMAGVAVFLAVALSIVASRPAANPANSLPLIAVLCAFTPVAAIASQLLPRLVAAQNRKVLAAKAGENPGSSAGITDDALIAVSTAAGIVGAAPLEGAAMFAVLTFLQTANWWLLAIPAALLLLMLTWWPSTGRLKRWVAEQRELIDRNQ